MATFTKKLLSGSTNGKNIKVAATSGTGTLIHTAVSGTSALDEVYLYAINTSTSSVKVTIQWGETTSPDGEIEATIPGEAGPVQLVDGWLLQNGLAIRAFAGTTNVILINGFVHTIQ